MVTMPSAKMPESYVNDLRAIDGVADVDSIRKIAAAVESPKFADGKQQVVVLVRGGRPRRRTVRRSVPAASASW